MSCVEDEEESVTVLWTRMHDRSDKQWLCWVSSGEFLHQLAWTWRHQTMEMVSNA